MSSQENLTFKPRARLLLQLGDQLIRNEKIALLELAKNAYDADSPFVKINMNNVYDTEKGEIIILDEGTGMDLDTIKNVWMEPGTDYREKQFNKRCRTEKFKRLPLGEKGIGRFAVHKLGQVIQLITRKKDSSEIVVSIDWKTFEKEKYLSGVKVTIEERDPLKFRGDKSGTFIKITDLRNKWTRGMIRDAYRAITSIVNPFESNEPEETDEKKKPEESEQTEESEETGFKIIFKCPHYPDVLKGLKNAEEMLDYALWDVTCTIDGKNYAIDYSFLPWESMRNKLRPRKNESFTGKLIDPTNRKSSRIDLSGENIGQVILKLYIFDRDTNVLNLIMGDKSQLKKFLDNNGGIRVYRDGIRVYDYGEEENDWLELGIRRINEPVKKISNNIVLGAVFLDRECSESLIEKTNREGFVENEAYDLLKKAIVYVISKVETQRFFDKRRIRAEFSKKSKKQPVYAIFDELKQKIEKKVTDVRVRKNLINHINRAEKEYNEAKEHLLRSSGAGLSLSIVIHEFEKAIKALVKIVEKEKSSERIMNLVNHLSKLTSGFIILIRPGKLSTHDLKGVVHQALFNFEYRFKVHDIEVIDGFSEISCNTEVKCNEGYILMAIMNLLDNSIWWLGHRYEQAKGMKKIFITISKMDTGALKLIVADNGTGFTIPVENLTEPLISDKPGGMGLGLYIADEIMKAHKGTVFFPDRNDLDLPKDLDGAVIGLLFGGSE